MTAELKTDHDLLVVAITKLDALSASFNELKASLAAKADAGQVEHVETRLDRLEERADRTEKKVYLILGAAGLAEVLLKFVVR